MKNEQVKDVVKDEGRIWTGEIYGRMKERRERRKGEG